MGTKRGDHAILKDNPLLLLGRFLSPWSTNEQIVRAVTVPGEKGGDWEPFLTYALRQWCTPFLYEQFQSHDLVDSLPSAVRDTLKQHCLTNRVRNTVFRKVLLSLLRQCNAKNIEIVLLKGAATFTDNLYQGAGARAMLDIDLLVKQDNIDEVRKMLAEQGFEEILDPGKLPDGLPTDERHAHINGYRKPGTPVIVELHYNVAYGQGGRIVSAMQAWQHLDHMELDGEKTFILSPTWRLLHNTVHGLIPSCDYIRGEIRFLHLLEFACLAKRYWHEIDWRMWLRAAKPEGAETAFLAYLHLACKVYDMPWPRVLTSTTLPRLHGTRLFWASSCAARQVGCCLSGCSWFRVLWLRLYYYLKLPVWVWENICYAPGIDNLPVRIRMLLKKTLSSRSRKKI